jgi:anhydro-N-acetylmuramic acid kinase
MSDYYIGLMSGTSLDAVDAALVDFSNNTPTLAQAINYPLAPELRNAIQNLCTPGDNEIERLGRIDIQLATTFADAVKQLLKASKINAEQIRAIGSHGQTIRHRPDLANGQHFTLQIGDPNTLAELTGITTVADFRRRDMAAGGQGAPLAPAFHAAMFSSASQTRVILNIGGIANVTLLSAQLPAQLPAQKAAQSPTQTHTPKPTPVIGFDTGPGNVLMDAWIQRHRQQAFDENGQWAASGKVNPRLLELFLEDEFFPRSPPKSSGREHFNLAWLDTQLTRFDQPIEPTDVQATLSELTAQSVWETMARLALDQLVVCGGGARNTDLMRRLGDKFSAASVITSDELGLPAEWVEAAAFAWLARESLAHRPGNLPSVTGARRPVVLGGIYPASL